jgi:hypothetical protein
MGQGPGIVQREILRRARGAFTVRDIAQKLFVKTDRTKLGRVRRAMRGLEAIGYLAREPDGRCYRRTAKRQPKRREWHNEIGPDRITLSEANAMLAAHYLGPMNGPILAYALATPARDAVAIFKPPMAVSLNAAFSRPLELSRLWRADDCPFPMSQFLAACFGWIKRTMAAEKRPVDCILAYTDPEARNSETARRHRGGVYVAAGFTLLGPSASMPYWLKPDGSRVEARQVQRTYGTKDRAKVAVLDPSLEYVPGEAKTLFVLPVALTVDEVRARLGTGRYRHVLEPPNPWD